MIISCEDMTAYIRAGRARQWRHELGVSCSTWIAAKMDNRWYAILKGKDGYRLLPEVVSRVLDDVDEALSRTGGSDLPGPRGGLNRLTFAS